MNIAKSIFFLIFFNVIYLFDYQLSYANYTPTQKQPDRRTRAGGTRGCPSPIGDLFIVGANVENDVIIQQTGLTKPTLFYEIKTDKEETFLITIIDAENRLIYQKYLTVTPEQKKILITLDQPIQEGINYRVVAGLLCEGKEDGAIIINSLLLKVQYLTFLDQLTQTDQK